MIKEWPKNGSIVVLDADGLEVGVGERPCL